jgi:hypothetical protein
MITVRVARCRKVRQIFLLFALLTAPTALAQESDLLAMLKALPDILDVVPLKTDSTFSAGFMFRIRQPLDHADSSKGTLLQSVYLAHVGFRVPVVLETEGYAVHGGGRARELTTLLHGNQVIVEHRYFGKSVPDSMEWRYLTTKQAAEDLHHVTMLLKRLYTGKWVSSGTSKGGQTTLFYRYYFPDDVDASVPYVAPVNLSQEDPRILKFLRTVGTESQREKIRQFQITMLRREEEMLPLVDSLAGRRNFTFSIGKTMAYEYCVLEYPCAFWQYGSSSDDIPPPDAPADTLFNYLQKVSTIFYYADQGIKLYEPFQYQAYTEIGYYGYDITDFRGLLTAVKDPTNIILAPKHTDLTFHPETMYRVYTWLRDHGSNIIYIYGGNDLWGATAMELSGKTNALKFVKEGGSHRTRIKDLSPGQRDLLLRTLKGWLGLS